MTFTFPETSSTHEARLVGVRGVPLAVRRFGIATVLCFALLTWLSLVDRSDAATTVTSPAGLNFPFQQWTDQAMAPTPDTSVTVLYEDCQNASLGVACSTFDVGANRGFIWISPHWFTSNTYEGSVRKTFYHELAHVFDARHFNSADRAKVSAALGFPASRGWRDTDPSTDPYGFGITPSEWFAEAGAACYQGFLGTDVAYGYSRSWHETQAVCGLMAAAADRPLVTSPPSQRKSFGVSLRPGSTFRSPQSFLPGSIRISVTAAGRKRSWASVCNRDFAYGKVKVTVSSCGSKVTAWSLGKRAGKLTYSGILIRNSNARTNG